MLSSAKTHPPSTRPSVLLAPRRPAFCRGRPRKRPSFTLDERRVTAGGITRYCAGCQPTSVSGLTRGHAASPRRHSMMSHAARRANFQFFSAESSPCGSLWRISVLCPTALVLLQSATHHRRGQRGGRASPIGGRHGRGSRNLCSRCHACRLCSPVRAPLWTGLNYCRAVDLGTNIQSVPASSEARNANQWKVRKCNLTAVCILQKTRRDQWRGRKLLQIAFIYTNSTQKRFLRFAH